jgi:cytochrome c
MEVKAVGFRIVSGIKSFSAVAVVAMAVSGQAVATDDRSDVLERIKPIGQVNVAGQAEATVAEQAAPKAETATPEAGATEQAVSEATETAAAEAVNNLPATAAGDPSALATSKGCMACHQVAAKVVGPAYKDVAAKYKGDAAAVDALVKKVKAGGVGVWGQIPMPPNAAVSDEDLKTIVEWVLAQ